MKTHGMSYGHPSYKSWRAMLRRCLDPKFKDYPNYGGRGVCICKEWMDFDNFYRDMGDRPKGFSLDRIDTDGGYNLENCRWADTLTQARNKRNVRLVTFNGVTKSLHDFCDQLKLNYHTVNTRLSQQKWDISRALSTPTGRFS